MGRAPTPLHSASLAASWLGLGASGGWLLQRQSLSRLGSWSCPVVSLQETQSISASFPLVADTCGACDLSGQKTRWYCLL
jgi:hypothetical protein